MRKKSDPSLKAAPAAPEAAASAAAPAPAPAGVSAAAEARPAAVRGSFGRVQGGYAFGWAFDPADPARRLRVEIYEGPNLVAMGEAAHERKDLLDAGIGDGRCAFQIALPPGLFDGKERSLVARVAGSAEDLAGSPRVLRMDARVCEGEIIGMHGSAVKARITARSDAALKLALWDGMEWLADAELPGGASGRAREVSFPVPAQFLDGRVHWLRLTLREPDLPLAQAVLAAPFVSTPENALQLYARSFPAHLSASAAARYEALRRHVHELAAREDDPAALVTRLREVSRAHAQLTRGFENRRAAELEPMRLDRPESPRVSVVIPAHNKLPVTYHCLAALAFAANRASFEVIVVDDGSSDETRAIESLVEGITVVRHEAARGFIHASNAGGKAARGEYVVMLNNDTEVTSGWLDELLAVFEGFEDVGLVGGKLVYADGKLQEAGGIVFRNGDVWNYGRNGNAQDPRYNYTRQVDYCSGACIMLRRALWEELGGFDPHYAPAYFEDTDLAFRVRAKGLKVMYTPFARVVHFEGQSSGTDLSTGVKKFQAINEPKFRARWAAEIFRQDSSRNAEMIKDRGVTMRALVIDAQTPQPDKDAGSYAALQEIRLLQSLGFKCSFVPQNLAYLGNYTEVLQRMGVECLYAPFVGSIQELIRSRAAEFDLFYLTRYYVARDFVKLIREAAPRAKILFCNADLHFLREMRAAIGRKDPAAMAASLKTREDELSVMRSVDVTLSYSDAEHAVILSHNLDSTVVARCPWVFDPPAEVPPYAARRDIAFLGSYVHPPNAEAVEFFVREVMPRLAERVPDARLLVYGSGMTAGLRALESDRVLIKGYVAETREAYDHCRVFVAPLLSGAGIKGKVIESLGRGVPTVATALAVEGMKVRHEGEVMLAETPTEWAEAIALLYEDEKRWEAMSRAARAYVAAEFSRERGRKLMKAALEKSGIFL